MLDKLDDNQKPSTPVQFLYRLFHDVLPVARTALTHWTQVAREIPDDELRKQALASLETKRFHADGGSVYAAVKPAYTQTLVSLIVALQTISDYLDNLCDRCDVYDGTDFNQLHHAMRDAVRPGAKLQDYYAYRDTHDDGGYLASLVVTCQCELSKLPGYKAVAPHVEWLVERYCELQVHKHIHPAERTQRLVSWWEPFREQFPDIHWWEFAAATGSTLGMFSLFLAATEHPTEDDARQLFDLYFPWIGGLHILLDYLIDLHEDEVEGDYNFVACYDNPEYARSRIEWFVRNSLQQTYNLVWKPRNKRIHQDVIRGLLGMYLSDSKVARQVAVRKAKRLVWRFGPVAWMYYGACKLYRIVR